nr:glycosyltransferase [Bacillus sp. JCM 19034]
MKMILIAGGGMGLTKYMDIIHSINQFQETIQVICMVGNNHRMRKKIKAIPCRHHIHILEFTNDFMLYLKASDAIFTKAGGLTLAESLACETPIIIFKPVPGHEEQNAELLMEVGAALKVNHRNEIASILRKVLFEKELVISMKRKARKLKKPDAANQIVQQILQLESNYN